MIFKRISDADATIYPRKFFSTGTLFTKVIKIIDQHDWLLRYRRPCSKVFQVSYALLNNSRFLINLTRPRCFLNEYVMLTSPAAQ